MTTTMNDRPRVEWAEDRKFERGQMVLTVWRLPLRRPQFRFNIGCKGQNEGQVYRGFLVKFEGQGKLALQCSFDSEVLNDLVAEAMSYMSGEVRAVEDERIERMSKFEERGVSKDKTKPLMSLKALAKRDAALRKIREQG